MNTLKITENIMSHDLSHDLQTRTSVQVHRVRTAAAVWIESTGIAAPASEVTRESTVKQVSR